MGLMKQHKTDVVVSTTVEELSNDPYTRGSKSTSEWNKLTNWARRDRGPQFDYGTAIYMVPKESKEYYKGVERVNPYVPESEPAQQQLVPPTPTLLAKQPSTSVAASGTNTPTQTGTRRSARTRGGN
ncbi:hypothetical protein BT69DRAFT_1354615 [Atractiella rhizophila]|nr:hypothetical protein BT69DRAFT_1356416 [Atractiella rhizophila]KAH8917601.1 hypothetical protein BT69DRAFT_1354615 [Atractiella rhizophila]